LLFLPVCDEILEKQKRFLLLTPNYMQFKYTCGFDQLPLGMKRKAAARKTLRNAPFLFFSKCITTTKLMLRTKTLSYNTKQICLCYITSLT